jgi:hypothetical protein
MRGMYKYIATGSQLPEALAWSTRETASSSNFVCIGADPKAEAARTSAGCAVSKQPTAAKPGPEPSAGSAASNVCAPSCPASEQHPQPTVPFQWGAPPGL